jgi:hypothetical protein
MSRESNGPTAAGRVRGVALAAALAALAAALPAAGVAATAKPVTYNYNVSVNKLALARGTNVKAKAVVTFPEAKVKSWWSQATVAKVVRKGVNGGFQRPYKTQGYNCGVVVKGATTRFTCNLHGADVATSIRLTFAVVYRGDNASG